MSSLTMKLGASKSSTTKCHLSFLRMSLRLLATLPDSPNREAGRVATKAIEILPEPVDRLQLVPETYIGGEASQVEVA